MEDKTMGIPRGDNVPIRDNGSATHRKLYLRYDLVLFDVSSCEGNTMTMPLFHNKDTPEG